MATTNHERVGRALALLSAGLAPFAEREFEAAYGPTWLDEVQQNDRSAGGLPQRVSTTDVQFLLKAVWNEWNTVFRKVLGQGERTLVSELRDIRNRWAHQEPFSSDDAYRALDSTHRLLTAVSAAKEAEAVDKAKQELLRARYEEQARRTHRKAAAVAPVEGKPAPGLRPWREIVMPHPDVASGRYQEAEFAADLHQVWRGAATDEYNDPVQFFRRTFLTEGLRELLVNAARRLSREGGDPLVELQTNFGGGKTHSLIALYHLAGGTAAADLAGVDAVLKEVGVASVEAQRAVLVGQMIGAGQVHEKPDGTKVQTLWGELAWQLGGKDAYDHIADADRTGTSPGSALVDLFQAYTPCLILIDEWVAYARQLYGIDGLPAGSFDAQFTFAQALAEAARAVPGVLLVVSIPASDIEVGGEGGQQALQRLKNVVGRMESPWRPASADEGFEIVRRRLFEEVPADKATERDAVVRAFADLYRHQTAEFPSPCREGEYERRIAGAYPIHPELFDRLYNEWSTLDKFQRTRGVLRLMAAVIHELWERQDASLLIMPGSVPIDAAPVASELTRYLEEGWSPVIERDVDGANSLSLRLDRENPNLGRYSATRRVARAIYMGSAPIQRSANRGIDDRSIKLGCVQPGEAPATFGDALRRLTDQATYLYVDGQRYWYAKQATVARLANDRAESHFSESDADEEIARRLREVGRRDRGEFRAVHPVPSGPADVPDDPEARLVILGPEYPHSSKTDDSPARDMAGRLLDSRGSGDRRFRNTLVFLAPDRSRLEELRDATRQWLAWKSIDEEREQLNLDNWGIRQVETKRQQFDEVILARLGETWQWLIAPSQPADDPTGPVRWEETRLSGPEALPVRASRRLASEEGLISEYSGVRLRMDLDRIPLWPGDANHVPVSQLWETYAKYLYLPRLRDSAALVEAIRNGISALTWQTDTFAYAAAFDADKDRYLGLVAGQQAEVVLDASAVIVKPAVAAAQLDAEAKTGGDTPANGDGGGTRGGDGGGNGDGDGGETATDPRRFYGRVTLEPVRLLRDVGQISEALIAHLNRLDGSNVRITVEIEADASDGFPEDLRRTVSENARTLKFESSEFES
ncbi:MAG: Swt1 family HEPN domain-containing protein [Solirubrobacteraceae bacterium]